jgi:glutamine amidotransferase
MTQAVAIIDYGSGNLRSVEKAFERAARESGVARTVSVTDDPETIAGADRVVLPGVGAFAACMAGLTARTGVVEALEHAVLVNGRPFLGICVGMQLLAEYGREFGDHQGLGWIPGAVQAIEVSGALTTPHMGWNAVEAKAASSPLAAFDGAAFYFAHSFHFVPENDTHVYGVTRHGGPLVASVGRDNILGVQFHPEKSQAAGIGLIGAFLGWAP